jgi:hypothetical protein
MRNIWCRTLAPSMVNGVGGKAAGWAAACSLKV